MTINDTIEANFKLFVKAGHWYAIGVKDMNGIYHWDTAPIYFYDGDGHWYDEQGNFVTQVYDKDLGMNISINAADGYMLQSHRNDEP